MNLNGAFGHWLKQRRAALDLTQAELADQVGCSTITIRKIETDERRPSKQISERLADVLAISLEDRDAFLTFARRLPDPELFDDLAAFAPAHNLPAQATPFIGRERELAQIAERMADPACRLLTLVGPGGIGKTRLALQAAADRVGEYADGVFFVSLTPVGETTMIPAAIASALQISFYGQEAPDKQVINYLRRKQLLLVLDNFEHLLGGIGLLTDILANAPNVKLLTTSRERLNIQQEWALPLKGLPYPTHETEDGQSRYSAVELFAQTARRVQPDFSLEDNLAGVIDICRAVEGMPLGLELAASWLRAMPCAQIAAQIRRDLDFLATPLRNVAERHRSLRAVFEHSWGLLSPAERDVVMKLSVFRGGGDLEAAQQVAGASLEMLAGLVDKSLVRLDPAGRYEMHELLRQFAADKLVESGEADTIRQRHLQYYVSLAEQFETCYFGPQHLAWLDRLEVEHDNCRAALGWAQQAGDVESGLRLGGALGWFWNRRSYLHEGREWLKAFLASGCDASASSRAKALHHVLELSYELADLDYAEARWDEALDASCEVDDPRIRAWMLCSLGFVGGYFDKPYQTFLEEALVWFRQLGDQWGICETLGRIAVTFVQRGEFALAKTLHEEVIRLCRQAGDRSVLAWTLALSACRNWYQGMIDQQTISLYHESLALFRELRYKNGIKLVLQMLGKIAQTQGHGEDARLFFEKSLSMSQQMGSSKGYVEECLVDLAEVFCTNGQAERGARLLGSVESVILTLWPCAMQRGEECRSSYERVLAVARDHLEDSAFASAFAEGQRMTLDEAVAHALEAAVAETA